MQSRNSNSKWKAKANQGPVLSVVTDIPGVLPVLASEIVLVAAWWPTLSQLISANDNVADSNQGEDGN